MMARIDSLDNSYNRLNKVDSSKFWLLMASIIVSVLNYWFSDSSIMIAVTIIVLVGYFACSIISSIYANVLGNRRIKNTVEDGFGKDIDSEVQTEGYYNNQLKPGLDKFNLDVFESVFFTKRVFDNSVLKTYIADAVTLLIVILVLIFSTAQFGVVLFEAILGGDILLDLVQTIYFQNQINQLYSKYDRIYTSGEYKKKRHYLLSLAIRYERIKAFYSLRLDSKKFIEMNSRLSTEWDEYCKNKGLNNNN